MEDPRRNVPFRRLGRKSAPRSSSKMSLSPSSTWLRRAGSEWPLPPHGYDNAIIFGHARRQSPFVITQSFNDQHVIDQYSRFIDDVVELVVNRLMER